MADFPTTTNLQYFWEIFENRDALQQPPKLPQKSSQQLCTLADFLQLLIC